MPHALLSAYDKVGLASFAQSLQALGWSLLASAGTAKYLNQQAIWTRDVAELVGPPILGHKVVTLSREIHAALMADDSPEEQAELTRIGVPQIDLVYVDLYPLAEAVLDQDCTLQSVIEKTDIGGPAMLRAAAKGRRFVLCQTSQFAPVLDYILEQAQSPKHQNEHERFISSLVWQAEVAVARYCHVSADYHFSYAEAHDYRLL